MFDQDARGEPEEDALLKLPRPAVHTELVAGSAAVASPSRKMGNKIRNVGIFCTQMPQVSQNAALLLMDRAVQQNWERSSIVLAGAWNQAIFSPQWVAARVFPGGTPTATLAMLNTGGVLVQFGSDGVSFTVQPGRIELRSPPTHTAADVEAVALRILRALPETPIEAVGVNFAFDVSRPEGQLATLMNFTDAESLRSCGAVASDLLISRQLVFRDDSLNLRITHTAANNSFQIDLNYNFPIGSSASVSAERLSGASERARVSSMDLLRIVYGLNLE